VSVAKAADRYFDVHPWKVVEQGFDPAHSRTAESVFSLANEYMGVRGYFDEGYSGDRLVGVYLNGVFETSPNVSSPYRGIADHFCYMVNTVDWLATRIELDGERLDLGTCAFSGFTRALDMRSGVLSRSFTWTTQTGKCLTLTFLRTLSMATPSLAAQRIVFEALNFSAPVYVRAALDFSIVHESRQSSLFTVERADEQAGIYAMLGKTRTSGHMVHASFVLHPDPPEPVHEALGGPLFGAVFALPLEQGTPHVQDKLVRLHVEKDGAQTVGTTWDEATKRAAAFTGVSFGSIVEDNRRYWSNVWDKFDISIEGSDDNLQGIRYCMFQLNQTYHGSDSRLSIGAKGLTGESYNGHAFWDTETYCLPFYLFTNPLAAKNLLEYRYSGLAGAMDRAKALDCEGACYPVATLDGTECCDMWQHASLQFQASTGVAYGIWHYANVTGDEDFLHGHGIEMLVQICRFLATRGQWGPRTGQFGYYCVMGPDEFQMMVHNNAYTNFMAKKTFEFTLQVLEAMRSQSPDQYRDLVTRLRLQPSETATWQAMAAQMRIPFDQATGIIEQHDGFFDLPHIEVGAIPIEDFPLYNHWSYDRIYRNDMIKQPDVLMLMFLYNQQFSFESKKANFEYYEPRCVHESSLSPSVHSVLAAELDKRVLAYEFFQFGTRLDLDDYNRNTREGLHITAIAAAWVNIVYGFGGMRSDAPVLAFSPTVPDDWESYSFRVQYKGSVIKVDVNKRSASFCVIEGGPVTVVIYGEAHDVGAQGLEVATPRGRVATS
jgi:maltose phosphorylase